MKAIIIDATKRTITEVEVDGGLDSLQKAVGGYIELVRLDEGEDLYVNEEGLLHGEQNFFIYSGAHQPFAGNGIIIGNKPDGGQKSTKMTVEEVTERVKFAHISEVAAILRS